MERYQLWKVAATKANDGERWYLTGKTGKDKYPLQLKVMWLEFE